MTKKSIVGLVLILLIFVGYLYWIMPSKAVIGSVNARYEARIHEGVDSLVMVKQYGEAQNDQQGMEGNGDIADSASGANNATSVPLRHKKLGFFSANSQNPDLHVTVKNNLFTIDMQSLGASIQNVVLSDYLTFDSMPLEVITPGIDNMGLAFVDAHKDPIGTDSIPFAVFVGDKPLDEYSESSFEDGDTLALSVSEISDSLTVSFRAYVRDADTLPINPDSYLEFRYVFYHDRYEVDFDINFHHISQCISQSPDMSLTWKNRLNRQEQFDRSLKGKKASRNKDIERFNTSLYYKNIGDNADCLKEGRDGDKQITAPIEWVAYKQQFFCAILRSYNNGFRNAQQLKVSTDKSNAEGNYLCDMMSVIKPITTLPTMTSRWTWASILVPPNTVCCVKWTEALIGYCRWVGAFSSPNGSAVLPSSLFSTSWRALVGTMALSLSF